MCSIIIAKYCLSGASSSLAVSHKYQISINEAKKKRELQIRIKLQTVSILGNVRTLISVSVSRADLTQSLTYEVFFLIFFLTFLIFDTDVGKNCIDEPFVTSTFTAC